MSKKDKKDKASQLRADLGRDLVKELHRLVKRANSAGVSIMATAAYIYDENQIVRKVGLNLNIPGLNVPTYAFAFNHLDDIFRALQASNCDHTQRMGRTLQVGLNAMFTRDGTKYRIDTYDNVDASTNDVKEDIEQMLKKAADAVGEFQRMVPSAVVGGTAPETLRKVADLALISKDDDLQEFGKQMAEAVDCLLPRKQTDAAYPPVLRPVVAMEFETMRKVAGVLSHSIDTHVMGVVEQMQALLDNYAGKHVDIHPSPGRPAEPAPSPLAAAGGPFADQPIRKP